MRQRAEMDEHKMPQDEVVSRPAVYTGDAPKNDGVLSRIRALRSSGRGESRVRETRAPARRLHVPSWPVLLLVAISIALGVVILMGPARMYYAAWRDEGILEAQYAVVEAQYKDLTHDIERLQTLEGIEDLARRRGYAYPDEKALVVRELEEQEFVGTVSLEDAVEEHEKSLPWYVGVLDAFFDYHYK